MTHIRTTLAAREGLAAVAAELGVSTSALVAGVAQALAAEPTLLAAVRPRALEAAQQAAQSEADGKYRGSLARGRQMSEAAQAARRTR